MNQNNTPLWDAHKKLIIKNKDKYDVPIHKGGFIKHEMARHLKEVYKYDINSSKPIDNLANPQGVIGKAHNLFAKAFKADEAFFLINGTTSGIHAMMLSACKPEDKILVPRNMHKSALNAAILANLNIAFIEPEMDKEWMISHSITLKSLKRSLKKHPDAKAILMLNPSYFGTVSDLKTITEFAHKKGLIVLCDEAHGSHFTFSKDAPISAMEAGCDMAAMSLHKTGGSLTQSSAIVWKTKNIKSVNVWNSLALLTSTSPNYLLMSSLDSARKHLYFKGEEYFKDMVSNANYLRKELQKIEGIKVLDQERIDNLGIFNWDQSKVLINVSGIGASGFEVYDTLSNDFDIQTELGETNVILLIISAKDTRLKLNRFIRALNKIAAMHKTMPKTITKGRTLKNLPEMVMMPRRAFFSEKEEIPFTQSEGRISADTMMVYPPGIPALIPGQQITKEIIRYHKWIRKEDAIIINNASDPSKVIVVKENK